MPQRKPATKPKPMTLTEWQNAVRERTEGMQAGRRVQPLALLKRDVIANPEPWQALCSRAIPFAAACYKQIQLGIGEVGASHSRLRSMIRWIDSRADMWKGEAAEQYRELRRLIGEVDPEALPERDEMDRAHYGAHDPHLSIA